MRFIHICQHANFLSTVLKMKQKYKRAKPLVMQHYSSQQINNGGPATGALLLMNSDLKDEFTFIPLIQEYAPHGFNIKLLIELYKNIKNASPDILHIRGLQSDGFYGLLAGKLAGCKRIVVSVHGIYSDSSGLKGFKKWIFKSVIEPFTLRHADLVYCVCDYATKRPIILNYTKNLYGYIHNAAPDYSHVLKNDARKSIREEFGIDENDILAISVGRITIDKGFKVLLKSILKIKNTADNLKFFVVGEGDFLDEMKNEIQEYHLKNIFFLGKRSDVSKLLFASDFFVFPTLHENLSNALLEASAASLPIIATNVGGNPEVIKNNVTGVLINPNNEKELTEKILLLSKDANLRNRLGKAAYINIQENFSQKKIFEQIENMYKSIL